jgi:UDP-N-acetylmuramate-alanine ligase
MQMRRREARGTMGIHHKLGISGIFTTALALMLQPALTLALTGSTVEDSLNDVAHPSNRPNAAT